MGTYSSSCSNGSVINETKENIIDREMRIYKWRGQNIENFIPAVEFKCPSLVKEQQKWNEFVEKYKDKDYLELSQFKKQIEDVDNSEEPIIAFEKYACNLNELNHLLTISETVYTVVALLTAFEQIKKIYAHPVPIERRCCFVTLKGEVRGWVNSNPKSNQIQHNSQYKFFAERQIIESIKQIIKIVQHLSLRDPRSNSFFLTLNNFISNSKCQKNLYQFTKQFIEGYCRTANIEPSRNLSIALRRSKDLPILKFSRKSLLSKADSQQRKNKSIGHSNKYTSAISEQCRSQRASYEHEQSFAKNSVPQSTLASFICFNQSFIQRQPSPGVPFHFKQESLPFRMSELEAPKSARTQDHRKGLKGSQILPSTPKPRVSCAYDWNHQTKKEASISQNISQSSSAHNEKLSGKKQEEGTLLEGKFLTSRELTTFNLPKTRRDHKYRTSNLQSKVLRQISILDIGDQNSGNKENQGKKVHFRTSQDVKSSDTSIEPPPRPWITSKTISQLISDKDDGDSLVHSRGTSSEDCAPSSYSGALSTMGREVSMMKKRGHCQAQAH